MNYSWPNLGNSKIVKILEKNIESGHLANSYIFSGVKNLGKFSLAKSFAKNIFISDNPGLLKVDNILEVNSDFFVVEKNIDKKNISIEQIRELISSLSSGSFLNSYRIIIIKDAENLNQNSANALLKVLEEFKNKLVMILTVSNIDLLPKTIISRSQTLNLYPLSFDNVYKILISDFNASPSEAKNFARLSLGCPILAIRFLENREYYSNYEEIVKSLLLFFNSALFERIKIINEIYKYDISNGGDFNIIAIWQSIIRDLMLLNYGITDSLQNEFLVENFKALKVDLGFFSKNKEILNDCNEYLKNNISIKSVLEYIAVNV